jgi:Phage integrase family
VSIPARSTTARWWHASSSRFQVSMREYDGFATAASAETHSRLGRLPFRSISPVCPSANQDAGVLSPPPGLPQLPHQTLGDGNGYRGWWFPANSTRPGDHVHAKSVSDIIGNAMRRAGIPGTPHSLRHWYGTNLVAAGADLRTAQTLLLACQSADYSDLRPGRRRKTCGSDRPLDVADRS